jgi:F-box associated protein
MLTSLPVEILLLILEYLPATPLLSLRATSKALLDLINPQLFSYVSICPSSATRNRSRESREQQCFQCLTDPSSTIAPEITSLHIGPQRAARHYAPKRAKLVVKGALSDQDLIPSMYIKVA